MPQTPVPPVPQPVDEPTPLPRAPVPAMMAMPVPRPNPAPGQSAPAPGQPPPVPGQANAQPNSPAEPEHPHPVVSFWQQPWVQNVLPFVTSLAVHAVLLILAVTAAAVVVRRVQQVSEEQTIIPESTMADAGPPGGVPNVGPGNDPLKQAMQNNTPDAGTPDGWAQKAAPLNAAVMAEGGGSGDTEAGALIGPGALGAGSGKGLGAGVGNGTGGGAGDGGPLAMFGTPGGGGIGPKGPVFGAGGNAKRIAFVCDASGSMLNKMASLRIELAKAVTNLKIIQSFNIIFFQDQTIFALSKEALVPATSENKRGATHFLDTITTVGTTDPIPAIRMAFKQQPELMYLLTDGDFPDNKAVENEIRKLNKDKKVKVNTIAFVSDKDTDTEFLDVLKRIAQESGGTFKHVSENELNNQ